MNQAGRRERQKAEHRHASAEAGPPGDVVPRRIQSAARASRSRLARANGENRAKILVIEHDPATRETLALMLRYYGYDVTHTGDGREATRLLTHLTPDLVVMEWCTPGLAGFSLCLALRRRWPMMPIVIVTSRNEVFDGEPPFNAWLQKPIDPRLLNQVIHDELAPVRSS
jgi:CheY-like chemotaxis protein